MGRETPPQSLLFLELEVVLGNSLLVTLIVLIDVCHILNTQLDNLVLSPATHGIDAILQCEVVGRLCGGIERAFEEHLLDAFNLLTSQSDVTRPVLTIMFLLNYKEVGSLFD